MSDQPTTSTSEPVYAAAAKVGLAVTTVLSVVGGALALGVISSEQATAITEFGNYIVTNLPAVAAALVVIVGAVSGAVSSFATAWHARKSVVPTNSDLYDITPKPGVAGMAPAVNGEVQA